MSENVDWRTYVLDPHASVDRVCLQKTADAAFITLEAKGLKGFDELSNLMPEKVNGEHLAMLVRCLSSWRGHLPGWRHAVDVAKRALQAESKDPTDVLFGII
jgi:hypothetical protein